MGGLNVVTYRTESVRVIADHWPLATRLAARFAVSIRFVKYLENIDRSKTRFFGIFQSRVFNACLYFWGRFMGLRNKRSYGVGNFGGGTHKLLSYL